MRTITHLQSLGDRVYVWLEDKVTQRRFMWEAEAEGFTFQDGEAPTKRPLDCIMAVNPDHTLNYVGIIGHIAFDYAEDIGTKNLIRVNYCKYVNGDDDWLMTAPRRDIHH